MLVIKIKWFSKFNTISSASERIAHLSSRLGKFFYTRDRVIAARPPRDNPIRRYLKRRVVPLDRLAKKCRETDRVLLLLDILKDEPDQIIQVQTLDRKRSRLDLRSTGIKVSDLLKKWPRLFELHMDRKGRLWCGLTREAEDAVKEEEKLHEAYSDKAAESVTKLLMLSAHRRLPFFQISVFSKLLGIPTNFESTFVHNYPHLFRVVVNHNDVDCLELVSWNSEWAVSELEKSTLGLLNGYDFEPPIRLFLHFPISVHPYYTTQGPELLAYTESRIREFQRRAYLSPYGDANGREQPRMECAKRTVAIVHELLSFSIEKRLGLYGLGCGRRRCYLGLPHDLLRFFVKYDFVFYVAGVGDVPIVGLRTRKQVFLKDRYYDDGKLKEKCPLVVWKEKVERLMGFTNTIKYNRAMP